MAEDILPFVLWLYATTLIRDGLSGEVLSEETVYFYKLSLQTMQKAINSSGDLYPDSLIQGLACFAGTAVSWTCFMVPRPVDESL